MYDLLINNADIITMDGLRRVVRNGSIGITGNRISAVGESRDIRAEGGSMVIDAAGKTVIPGLVNTHTHFFQTLLKGLGDDVPLFDWFRRGLAPFVPSFTEESCYWAAMLGGIESIKSGCTSINDFMYIHPRPRLSDAVIRAMNEVGIRGVLSRGIVDSGRDHGMPEAVIQDTDEAVEDCERLLEAYKGRSEGRIGVWVAPASIWMSSRKAFRRSKTLADKYGAWVTWHAAETKSVVGDSQARYGMSDVKVVQEEGLLRGSTLAVHCVWLSDDELDLFGAGGVKVAHCPVANMYLGDGVAPVGKMLARGVTVGLGTDGAASNNNQDMLAVLKSAALLHKVHDLDPTAMTAPRALEMATSMGARAMGIEDEVGSIEVGKKADLVLLDLSKPNSVPVHNSASNIVYCATQENVQTVIIDGRVVMRDRRILTVSESEVIKNSARVAQELVGSSLQAQPTN